MKINLTNRLPKSEAIIIPLFKKTKLPAKIPADIQRQIKTVLAHRDFKGELNEKLVLFFSKTKVVLLGLGLPKTFSTENFRRAAGVGRKEINKLKAKKVVILLSKTIPPEYASAFVEGFILGDYRFSRYLNDTKNLPPPVDTLTFVTDQKKLEPLPEKSRLVAETVLYVRDLVNLPPKDMTPSLMAMEARKVARTRILNGKQITKLGLGCLAAVGQGSSEEPKLIIMEYKYKPKNKQPILLVGKGITFDSGGINLKQASPVFHLDEMKCDMSGAAVIIGLFKILQKIKLPLHLVGVIAAAENMPGGKAIKPGDIVRSFSGKTVEIVNTDAEGRLVLADALSYGIKRYNPETIIDIATLTGATIAALGHDITAMMTNNRKMAEKMKQAAENTGEKIWEMPLDKDYAEKVKSDIADLKNLSVGTHAGVIMGGLFLEQFVNKEPWIHLDIGGSAWSQEEKYYISKGGTGRNVRLLWSFLENY